MEKIKIEDLKEYYYLSQLKYAPDGLSTALIGKKADNKNGYYSTVFVNKGEGYYPLTSVKGNVTSYIWLDAEHILFTEIREAEQREQLAKGFELTPFYKINIHLGEAQHVFTVNASVTEISMLDNENFVVNTLFDNNRPDLTGKEIHEQKALLKKFNEEKSVQVIDELPYWSNGTAGYVNKKRKRLYLFNKEKGLQPLTKKLGSVAGFKVSPCKKYILFTGETEQGDIKALKNNLYLINLENNTTETLLKEDMFIKSFDFCGKDVVFAASFGENYFFQEHPDFYKLNIDTKAVSKITVYDRSIESSVGSDCVLGGGIMSKAFGDDYYFVSVDGFYADIYKLSLATGAITNVTALKGSVCMFDISEQGIVLIGLLEGKLQEVYTFDKDCKKVSSFNDAIYNARKHPELDHHVITDSEGVEFDGWILYPVDYDKNKKYPAILNIHGGPKAVYGDVFFHEMQYWASEGYFVLFSNPRGSDGKGNEFADLRGLYGTIDYDNLMMFTEAMCDKYPAIDKDRIGVTGGSYGGYMVNWMIGHTDRFKAGASQRSISNWVSYAIGDLGYFFTDHDIKANTWNNTEKLWWHSPLKYADKAKTPTLFIHSQQDYRCCVPEALQMFSALKLHGVDTKLVLFEGENHELSRSGKTNHRIRRIREITQWMDRYLK